MDDDVAAQFAAMGAEIAAEAAQDEDGFEVMLANADTIKAWLACGTQWRVAAGMTCLIWLGLDYAGVDVVLKRMQPADPDAVFQDLQLMEDEALDTFAENAT